jgi:hypothetical protein
MRALSAADLLAVWERGNALSPPRRALLLLAAALPDAGPEALGRLSVGRRDGLLLGIRAAVFGPRLEALGTCDGCGERAEVDFDTERLLGPAETPPVSLELRIGDVALELRLPDASDLVALADAVDGADAERALLRRCVAAARCGDRSVAPEDLPAPVVDAIAARLSEADPLAEVRLALACPACGRPWSETLDVGGFFWREIEAWAARLLDEVHVLASAYGWTERDVLALTPLRRRHYLERVAS